MFSRFTTVYVEIKHCSHSCGCGHVEAGFCGSTIGAEAIRFYVGEYITYTRYDHEKSDRLQREQDAIKDIVGEMYFEVMETATRTKKLKRDVRILKVNEALAIVGRMGDYEYKDPEPEARFADVTTTKGTHEKNGLIETRKVPGCMPENPIGTPPRFERPEKSDIEGMGIGGVHED